MANRIEQVMRRFLDSGVMAIVRIDDAGQVMPTMQALIRGGVEVIEISLVTPHALTYIERIHEELGDAIAIGAGTVLDSESARAAALAGADFVVTPVTRPEVIAMARRYGRAAMAGGYTPSECLLAWEAGAEVVKVFPAMPAGPAYLKAIHAPLPQIPLVPVGGVTFENLAAFIKAGACAVAGASNLANPALVKAGRFDEITRTAEAWVQAAREAKGA